MKMLNCDIYKFIDIVKNKNLICFGSGKALNNFVNRYFDLTIENYISYIADNDVNKIGTKKKLIQKEIPIISPSNIKDMDNVILLITCTDIEGILEQLSVYSELNNIWCFYYVFINSATNAKDDEKRYYPDSFKITSDPIIPKKIHYCWFGNNPIPEKNLLWMESWKKYCPDYEIICWDESNYDITKNNYMYEAYKAKKWGFVPDYARLDIIYNYGGIYLDTDVELISSLDDLLYQCAFAGVDSTQLISLGLGFGAVKNCEIIGELLELYSSLLFKKSDGSLNIISAPKLQKDFFATKGFNNNGTYQIVKDLTVYPEKVLSPKDNTTGIILTTQHTKAIHHYDASWVSVERKRSIEYLHRLFSTIRDVE